MTVKMHGRLLSYKYGSPFSKKKCNFFEHFSLKEFRKDILESLVWNLDGIVLQINKVSQTQESTRGLKLRIISMRL